MSFRLLISLGCAAFLALAGEAGAQTLPTDDEGPGFVVETLRETRITSRAPRRFRPRLGFPLKLDLSLKDGTINTLNDYESAEAIIFKEGTWTSSDPETGMVNWVIWEPDPLTLGNLRDRYVPRLPEGVFLADSTIWKRVIDFSYDWSFEKPYGGTTIVAGPIVLGGSDLPFAHFVAVCKKTASGLGWKSLAFLVPNRETDFKGLYDIACSVNVIEVKSGYNLFASLPEGVQELIEEMTPYELFCPFHEVEEGFEPEFEMDFEGGLMDYLDDLREGMM